MSVELAIAISTTSSEVPLRISSVRVAWEVICSTAVVRTSSEGSSLAISARTDCFVILSTARSLAAQSSLSRASLYCSLAYQELNLALMDMASLLLSTDCVEEGGFGNRKDRDQRLME